MTKPTFHIIFVNQEGHNILKLCHAFIPIYEKDGSLYFMCSEMYESGYFLNFIIKPDLQVDRSRPKCELSLPARCIAFVFSSWEEEKNRFPGFHNIVASDNNRQVD